MSESRKLQVSVPTSKAEFDTYIANQVEHLATQESTGMEEYLHKMWKASGLTIDEFVDTYTVEDHGTDFFAYGPDKGDYHMKLCRVFKLVPRMPHG